MSEGFEIKLTEPVILTAQQCILAAIINDGAGFDLVGEQLTENHFTVNFYKHVFRAAKQLAFEKKPIDKLSLADEINKSKIWSADDLLQEIELLSQNSMGGYKYIQHRINILTNARARSFASDAMASLQTQIDTDGHLCSDQIVNVFESIITNVQNDNFMGSGSDGAYDLLKGYFDTFDDDRPDDFIPTGYADIDKLLCGGMRGGELIIIAARPSIGKTTLGMNIAEHVATAQNKGVLVFSMEMSSESLLKRMIASLAKIDANKIRRAKPSEFSVLELERLSIVSSKLRSNSLRIIDENGMTPSKLRSMAKRVNREIKGLSLIVVDYIQLMQSNKSYSSRVYEIGEITAALKSLSKELNIPIIALSQLKRLNSSDAAKLPTMSDLKDSGCIEQDADLVALIHREDAFSPGSTRNGLAQIIIDKNRHGDTGIVNLTFTGNHNCFTNYTECAQIVHPVSTVPFSKVHNGYKQKWADPKEF